MRIFRRSFRNGVAWCQRLLLAGFLLLLSGCGTLKINIDYGWTPAAAGTEFPPTSPPRTATDAATPSAALNPTGTHSRVPPDTATVLPELRAVDLSAGERHTCIVSSRGGVHCWGNNENGQLGNGTMVTSNIPVEVKGLQDAVSVKAGWKHSCALTSGGGVKCWGYNRNGELGNGKTTDSSVPVDVAGLSSGVAAIGMGDDHTCAVTAAGGVKCWGYNDFGQLGDGTKTSRSIPVDVKGLSGKAAAAAGGWGHTCILTASGGIRCWGNNKYGQLGDGSAEIRTVPVAVDGMTQGAGKVAAGWNHTCAVMGNGELRCWGWNYYGQLGDATQATQTRPVNVRRMMEDAADVASGWAHTCALTAGGGVKCWGWNKFGQLGDGTNLDSQVPLTVTGWGGTVL
jgi:alpha-tubulin suppressor-like RCC1 family protein